MASPSFNDSCNSVTYLKHPDLRAETPSSDSGTTKYDVFLSFYGKDARYKFTSHLYAALTRHGIPTFMDTPELSTGDVIDDALAQAINASKIYVVVFSDNYAYSPWCLNELLEIYKCYQNMKRMIIGVYCNIDPSVVRHQTDSFAEAFKKHEQGRYKDRKELVNQWRTALTNVANLSGKSIPLQRSEADIIDEIIDVVLLKVNPKTLHVAKYPVGLNSAVKIVMPSLSSNKQGVIKFGIYGMGGVGKTTLAKAIYNQLLRGNFNDSSFLANVRENSGSMKGLASLQEQLINDILKSKIYVHVPNVDQGIAMIEARICSTKILVVIDDLDDIKQFESLVRSFASGSVVIITTRDEQMLDSIKVERRYRYKVNELDDAQSRALFTKYAFEDATVNNSLMEYSEDILRLAGGLPLALEVFGSYLSTQQSDVGWQSYIDKLKRYPNSSISQKLMISLDAIESDNPMLKQLFLDIACLFIGSKKDEAVEILETCYSFADHNIDILKKRCLLTLNSNEELRMHDLLRDMGREVARNGFLHNQPQNHSRLWMSEDISKVLTNKTGTKAIECIKHHDYTSLSFTMETFTRMTNLRFLRLQGGAVSGNFIKTFGDLKWLRWDYCPLTYVSSGFHPQNIVILELRNSMITKWESKMVFEKLKTINMSSSVHLVSTPDFNMFPCLETLHLHGCNSLKEFCIPVGSLKNLVSLNLWGCRSLKQLPDNLGNLTSLKKLNAEELSVSKVPASIGNLNKLVELRLNTNSVRLPDTICNLRALESLSIVVCNNLEELPKNLGDIISLTKLNVGHNEKLKSLPDSICNLKALEFLCIDDCTDLKELPKELGNMKSLKVLSAESLSVTGLPDSVGSLQKLVELRLYKNFKLTTLPNTISNLSSLEILNLRGCEEVNILPNELWELPSLRELDASDTTLLKKLPDIEPRQISTLPLMWMSLSRSGLTVLPRGFSYLSKLEELYLDDCSDLVSIPELPPNLKSISACDCKSLEILPNVSDLKQLEYLDLSNCSGLMEIQGLEELTSLTRPQLASQLSKLEELYLDDCSDLVSIPEIPPNLKSISTSGCKSLKILPNVSDMKQLVYLNSTNCSGLMEIQGLEELTSLRELYLGGCNLSLLGNTLTRRCFQV